MVAWAPPLGPGGRPPPIITWLAQNQIHPSYMGNSAFIHLAPPVNVGTVPLTSAGGQPLPPGFYQVTYNGQAPLSRPGRPRALTPTSGRAPCRPQAPCWIGWLTTPSSTIRRAGPRAPLARPPPALISPRLGRSQRAARAGCRPAASPPGSGFPPGGSTGAPSSGLHGGPPAPGQVLPADFEYGPPPNKLPPGGPGVPGSVNLGAPGPPTGGGYQEVGPPHRPPLRPPPGGPGGPTGVGAGSRKFSRVGSSMQES